MKNLLKKKSRIKVLLERSELIQFILCLLAMVLLCILNYLAARWECSLAIPDTNSGLFYKAERESPRLKPWAFSLGFVNLSLKGLLINAFLIC